ncbi:hypothetical protein SeMB42_g02926 [Synchytrium endobioticum]|uniref:RNA helicase n=1 Tax=Synchytrium endobioticum TaxID=286115 RepID=A0A507D424_9FUNG|nr:hypothetical protein SeLEV6574_g03364 [Synchytrium endobioticum]TPX48616.1 hypothetical protein SeMB42_g02926 [Synchytrium endobioticum]
MGKRQAPPSSASASSNCTAHSPTTSQTTATNADPSQSSAYYKEHSISISSDNNTILTPYTTFSQLKDDQKLKKSLMKPFKGFEKPTPIQASVWPYLFAGHDVVGIAKTGSGKTFAFALPAVHIIKKQHSTSKILALVLSPTRELAIQTHESFAAFGPKAHIHPFVMYGGTSKKEQKADFLKSQCNVLVATPGRLMDFMNDGVVDLRAVQIVILDEADRMLSFGFEQDIKTIMSSFRTARPQTIMFSATWPPEIRALAATYLSAPTTRITVGSDELAANTDITQIVEVIGPDAKEARLLHILKQHATAPTAGEHNLVLIFVLYKYEAPKLEKLLSSHRGGYAGMVASIHGDKNQRDRLHALESFKSGKTPILVATDVAARGLDIPEVRCVINFTYPLTTEEYCHRIGRTGRAGRKGVAYTFFTSNEKNHAGALVNVLKKANQTVPQALINFGTTVKRKVDPNYGAFTKDVDMSVKGKKIKFTCDDE